VKTKKGGWWWWYWSSTKIVWEENWHRWKEYVAGKILRVSKKKKSLLMLDE
jgi:hypothetical protein